MRRAQAALAGLGRFVWDLLVGDDWRIAAAIAVVLVLGAFATATSVVPGAVLAPVLAAALVAVTLTTLLIGKQACAVSNDGKRTFTSSGVFSGGSLGYPKVTYRDIGRLRSLTRGKSLHVDEPFQTTRTELSAPRNVSMAFLIHCRMGTGLVKKLLALMCCTSTANSGLLGWIYGPGQAD